MTQPESEGTRSSLKDDLRGAAESAYDTVNRTAHQLADRSYAGAQQLEQRTRHARELGMDYARRAGASTGEFVTSNALPLSLIGLGVGWLVLSMRRQNQVDEGYYASRYSYELEDDFQQADPYLATRSTGREQSMSGSSMMGDVQQRAGELASRVRETTGELASRVSASVGGARSRVNEQLGQARTALTDGIDHTRQRAGALASQVGQHASEWSHQARGRLTDAQRRSMEYADENPLAVGAIAIAAGFGVGLALPTTRRENQLLGEHRDRLMSDARGLLGEARDAARQVQRQARETVGEVRSSVSEQLGQAGRETRISH